MENTGGSNNPMDEQILQFFRTLCDSNRLKMAGLLGIRPLTLEQVAEQLKLRPQEAVKHLERLTQAGLVKRDGAAYALDTKALELMARSALENERQKPGETAFKGEAEERKVLQAFIRPDGRLKELPAQHKKLLIVLRHVADSFENGQRYTEKQVNEHLHRFFEDHASLRRYLVDEMLMQRENGIYWRAE
jgi:hypothetical protein